MSSSENRIGGYNKMWCLTYFVTPVYKECRFEGGTILKINHERVNIYNIIIAARQMINTGSSCV